MNPLFENEFLIAFSKPEGISSAPISGGELSFAEKVCAHSPLPEFGLVHRLDRDTSGVLLFAKTEGALAVIREHWKSDAVRKFYTAIATQKPERYRSFVNESLPWHITQPLARSAKSQKRMLVLPTQSAIRGEPLESETLVTEIKKLAQDQLRLEIEIKTGRMHQIRAHLAWAGLPLLGDHAYSGQESHRLHLHSHRLSLRIPELGLEDGIDILSPSPF
jgi:23S rRNA pseudouridine955/2504/2580 synthase